MDFVLSFEEKLKEELKNISAKVLVDKNVGGDLLGIFKKSFAKFEFVHVGSTDKSDASDDEIISYARENGFDMVVTMDYGMARKALLNGLGVIMIFAFREHKYYLITYLTRLGEVRLKIESTL